MHEPSRQGPAGQGRSRQELAGQGPSDLIQSVSRALRILECVGEHPRGATPKAVAATCDLSLSTTYHLLRTLAWEGYLRRLPSGDYVVGSEVADRFRDLVAVLTGPPESSAVLRDLAADTGLSAYAAQLVDGRVTIVQVAEAPGSPLLEDLVPGFDEAAHATALGKALLSTLDRGARRAYLDEVGMRRFTSMTLSDPAALEHQLQHETVFLEECQYRVDVSCMAVLVSDADTPTALAVSARATDLARRRDHLTRALQLSATGLAGIPPTSVAEVAEPA